MTTILHIDSSARHEGSITRQLSAHAVAQLKAEHPGAKIVYRDLTRHPLPHIDPDFIAGSFGVSKEGAAGEAVKRSDDLIAELFAADIIVIGAPMYNFSIPSQLKAWIDHICAKGKTFAYSETGPKGLVTGKRAIVVSGTGGVYSEGPMAVFNHVIPYMTQVLGFIGITDVQSAVAERQGFGPEVAAEGLAIAMKALGNTLKKAA